MSPPEIEVTQTLSSGVSVVETVRIQRGVNDSGSLFFEVDPHGDCDSCIQGAAYVIMPSDEDAVEYQFTVTSGNLATGSYTEYIAFVLYGEAVGGIGSQSSIQQGVTATVRFSVEGASSSSSSGGSGGSSSSGSSGGGSSSSIPDSSEESDPEPVDEGDEVTTTEPVEEPEEPTSDESAEGDTEESSSEDLASDSSSLGGSGAEESSSSVSVEPVDVSSVLVDDEVAGSADVQSLLERFATGECDTECDVNGDGEVGFSDVVQYASGVEYIDDRPPATPPVVSGPPLSSEDVVFYFQVGDEVGKYDIVVASTKELASLEDYVTFYLLVDTGPSGTIAADVSFSYNPKVFRYVGVDTVGSIFPFTQAVAEDGTVRLLTISRASFAGTHGYLAAVHFQPLSEGEGNLVFDTVMAYHSGVVPPPIVGTQSFFGQLVAKGLLEIATSKETVVDVQIVSDGRTCGCLKPENIVICLMLLILMLLAVFGLSLLAYRHLKLKRASAQKKI